MGKSAKTEAKRSMTRSGGLICGLMMAVLAGPLSTARAQPTEGLSAVAALEQTITQVIEQAEPSVVSIARIQHNRGDRLFSGDLRGQDERGPRDLLPNQFGSGIIVAPPQSERRFVLTAYHVVRGGATVNRRGRGEESELRVWLPSQHELSAAIYAADPRCDLAVLKLDERSGKLKPGQLRPISWSTAAPVHKGQLVITLGNPYWIARDGSPSASWGIVSNLVRRPAVLTNPQTGSATLLNIGTAMQIEQRLPIGASGGPVINLRGELVGVASSLAALDGYERSGGFAFPIDPRTRWIVETLLAGREVEYGFLGLRPERIVLRDDLAERLGQMTAAEVHDLRSGSPAHLAGLRNQDVIVAIDGQPIRSDIDLMREATLHPPETVIQVTVCRGATELTLKVKLGKWPVPDEEGIIAAERRYPLWRGLAVDYATGRERYFRSLLEVPAAVVVTEVAPDSPAQEARLQPGDFITHVNGKPVRTPAEFAEAVKAVKSGDVSLRLRPLDRPADEGGRTLVIKDKSAAP